MRISPASLILLNSFLFLKFGTWKLAAVLSLELSYTEWGSHCLFLYLWVGKGVHLTIV